MFDASLQGNILKRSFDDLEKQELGKSIYALRDPRDGKIFYIGQGVDDRIFNHFTEAEDCLKQNKVASSKVIRILDIWKNNEDVDWFIVAHNLQQEYNTDKFSDIVESAVIDVLSQSQNGICLNEIKGPKSSMLTQEDIKLLAAAPINPTFAMDKVFIFPIQNGLADGKSEYDATRSAWYVKQEYQGTPAYAVGIKNGISHGSFLIDEWKPIGNKHEFRGTEFDALKGKSWLSILSKVKGYWQRGNYIIVKFDGNGKCKIIRGAGQENIWFDL
jgi:hypothetical protein